MSNAAQRITEQKNEMTVTYKLPERFDFACREDFRALIDRGRDASTIVIDMVETTYVDSSALGMMLLLRNSCRNVKIINATGYVKKVLAVASFNELFSVE